MKKSVFSAAKLANLSTVAKGVKASNDVRPAITTARGFNKFTMNASASAMIGCQHGDRLVMFAMPDADSINEKFFVALSTGDTGCKLSTAGKTMGTGRPLNFNYAGIWSQMLMKDPKANPVGEKILESNGLMAEFETQKNKDGVMCKAMLATKQVEYTLELVVDEDGEAIAVPIDDVLYERIFVLKDPKDIEVANTTTDIEDTEVEHDVNTENMTDSEFEEI